MVYEACIDQSSGASLQYTALNILEKRDTRMHQSNLEDRPSQRILLGQPLTLATRLPPCLESFMTYDYTSPLAKIREYWNTL